MQRHSSNMKILFIEPCFVNFGGYFRAYNICSNLAKKKIKVDLLCASRNPFQFHIKKTQYNKYFTLYELPRFQYHFFLNGRILRGLLAAMFGLIGGYDIIHAAVPVQLESNIPAFILKFFGKKVVMDWDDYWEGSTIYGNIEIMKKYVAFCEQKAPGYFKNMVVVSEFLKQKAINRGATHVLKLINAVNKQQFTVHKRVESRKKLGLSQNDRYLITFGNTYINNRALLLFKVFERILQKEPDVKLLFNLDAKKIIEEEKIESKINMNILKNIITVGNIPQDDQGYYLAAADAVIFIMPDTDAERACYPIRIGSYINGESILILNDINSEASNSLKPYNCAIIDTDLKRLADHAVHYLNDEQLQKTMHRNVLKAKDLMSWETKIDDLITFYKSI